MGGYHVAVRRAEGNYIGVRSFLKLPDICKGVRDNGGNNGIHPEFVHGFYRGSTYGLDIGVIYRNGDWKLFYSGFSSTLKKIYDETSVSLNLGETVELASYIDFGKEAIVVKVEKNGRTLGVLDAPLCSTAFNEMKKGCDITRELLMATNRTSGYVPEEARFEFAKFFKGTLTDKYWNYTPFVGGYEGSKGDEPYLYDSSRVKHLGALENYGGTVYGCEVGSCTFENDKDFEINW
ncbi:hypothetical protein [Tepidibacter formicigenes]|jgi:hypothetical protein|uniref:Uncharacterized protein n=1 Tax=Tepidibacter formicigenes DSM 15518 TaxID=1123349 RepID=A0A1M6U1M3_9FIRM|nr:hypothetical protein [Tepidibacter formicigenes]SHK63192.1 hypothetical protein SAMN02744037_02721 [Tepidibacter formicigenes DSM 15518]